MSLLGTCPSCGERAPLAAYLVDAEARRALAGLCQTLADYPEVVRRLPGYLGLHSRRGRSASWGKIARLIDELGALINAGTVTRASVRRPCPPALWAQAMDAAEDAARAGTLEIPLAGHGWLAQVAWSQAGLAETQAEGQRQALARGETPLAYSPAHNPAHNQAAAAPVAADIQELASDLRALQRLDAAAPSVHAERIASLRARIEALAPTPPAQG